MLENSGAGLHHLEGNRFGPKFSILTMLSHEDKYIFHISQNYVSYMKIFEIL